MEEVKFQPDVWRDGTSSHKRGVQQDFDYNACADRVLARGYICAGCHFDTRCNVISRFTEMRREEQRKYNESLVHGPHTEDTQVRLVDPDDGFPFGVRE